MTQFVTDEEVQNLIDAHFPSAIFTNMTERQKECVRSAIVCAITVGAAKSMVSGENSHLAMIMAKEVVEFEKTVDSATNLTRTLSSAYPWGWHYEDDDVQKKFREFCQRNKVESA